MDYIDGLPFINILSCFEDNFTTDRLTKLKIYSVCMACLRSNDFVTLSTS